MKYNLGNQTEAIFFILCFLNFIGDIILVTDFVLTDIQFHSTSWLIDTGRQ